MGDYIKVEATELRVVHWDGRGWTRRDWQRYAGRWMYDRMGLLDAQRGEFVAGYVDDFQPVYVQAGKKWEDEPWLVWFVTPGVGRTMRIVCKVMEGVYVDHEGTVHEHDPAWVIVLGTVTRVGT